MRTTKELLELVKYRFIAAREGERLLGLCNVVEQLLAENMINSKEFQYLEYYIKKHRPVNIRTLQGGNSDGYFYWNRHKIKPRIKWLNKHIRKNS